MLKAIKIGSLFSLALIPNLGNTHNETTLYIDTVTLAGNTSYFYIRTLYTVKENQDYGCDFYYTYEKDGKSKSIGSCHIDKLDICEAKEVPVFSEKVYSKDFGKQNDFTVTMVPENPLFSSESITLHYNVTGNSCVYYSEKDNDAGLSSGFIMESYYRDPSKYSKAEDRIKFLNFENDMVNETYNYFDISKLKFQYLKGRYKELTGDFYLDFIDSFALFNDLDLEEGTMYRRIPLTVKLDGDTSYFTFKDDLYYEQETHNMSSTYKVGYMPTQYLYFPKESFDKLHTITARLLLNIKGYVNFTMIAEFKILSVRKLFGDCSDSEYCIHSTEDLTENKREKEIEVEL